MIVRISQGDDEDIRIAYANLQQVADRPARTPFESQMLELNHQQISAWLDRSRRGENP